MFEAVQDAEHVESLPLSCVSLTVKDRFPSVNLVMDGGELVRKGGHPRGEHVAAVIRDESVFFGHLYEELSQFVFVCPLRFCRVEGLALKPIHRQIAITIIL